MTWKLKRVRQCKKCPWKVDTDPFDIPNGYSEDMHKRLSFTIASPGDIRGSRAAMACHEHPIGEEVYCVGWLVNQLGPGNNIGLRLRMLSCENSNEIKLDGEQHASFEDTLP
jgi:hypothetical protein